MIKLLNIIPFVSVPLFTLLMICPVIGKAQVQAKNDLLSAIVLDIIPDNWPFFYLVRQSEILGSEASFWEIQKDKEDIFPYNFVYKKLKQLKIDTSSRTWDCNNVTKSKCIDTAKILSVVSVPGGLERSYSNSIDQEKYNRKTKEELNDFRRKKACEKNVFIFSQPLFDSTITYAIIQTEKIGFNCSETCLKVYHLKDGVWKGNCIISKSVCN